MSAREARSGAFGAVLRFGGILFAVSAAYFVVMYARRRPRPVDVESQAPVPVAFSDRPLSLDPGSEQWLAVEPMTVPLFPQAARPPFGTQEREVVVRAVRSDRDIAIRMDFADDSANVPGADAGGAFEGGVAGLPSDACAVMLTPSDGPATAQMMGHGSRGDIWHWAAAQPDGLVAGRAPAAVGRPHFVPGRVRELRAAGPGTQAVLQGGGLEATGVYAQGTWRVVFKRPLASTVEGQVDLSGGAEVRVAFAVWDGARGEVLSAKSISILRGLDLRPGTGR